MPADQAAPDRPPFSGWLLSSSARRFTFIQANTRLIAPPLTPEVVLHLADESLPLWRKTEEQLGQVNVPPPYWAFAWPGGQALARYVLDNARLVAGKNVLDLGAGSGLAGIAALKAGAAGALAADIDPIARTAIKLNADANGVEVMTIASDQLAGPLTRSGASVVLAGDLFYERELAERVLFRLAEAAASGALVLAGDPSRAYFPADRFERLAEYAVPVSRDLEDCDLKLTGVHRLSYGI